MKLLRFFTAGMVFLLLPLLSGAQAIQTEPVYGPVRPAYLNPDAPYFGTMVDEAIPDTSPSKLSQPIEDQSGGESLIAIPEEEPIFIPVRLATTTPPSSTPPAPSGQKMQCSDGIDNDGDGQIDFPNDPGCVSPFDNDERNTVPAPGGAVPPGLRSPNNLFQTFLAPFIPATSSTSSPFLIYPGGGVPPGLRSASSSTSTPKIKPGGWVPPGLRPVASSTPASSSTSTPRVRPGGSVSPGLRSAFGAVRGFIVKIFHFIFR